MAKIPEVGEVIKGKVANIVSYGAFIDLEGYNRDGLLYISEIIDGYVKNVSDYLTTGQEIKVRVIKVDYQKNQISLSSKEFISLGEKSKKKRKKRSSYSHSGKYKYLPEDTNKAIGAEEIENYSLRLNKYIDKFDGREVDNRSFLENLNHKLTDSKLLNNVHARNKKQLEQFKNNGYKTDSFTMKNDYRMVVGLGAANILEINLLLHHIYGIPYIPGSSLKGLAKAYAVEELREKAGIEKYDTIEDILESEELSEKVIQRENIKDYEDKIRMYRQIFGTQKSAGNVIFFDSFPVKNINIKLDIMTPHFTDYYQEMESDNPKNYPTDYQEPNPITFLVLEDTVFRFSLAARIFNKEDRDMFQNYLETASALLKDGLKELGIGAKTMVGYGYFQEASHS
jgi:CRISPR-associated protein Cmr6